ncbi:hypothetical protein LCGC14_1546870 [marine sediment metagenome]|uniref:Uncharacterized protein n=1 Tax=marine sediment metagenome TaxID=412755 RepID=A0A0F9L7A1_9ZZZZ
MIGPRSLTEIRADRIRLHLSALHRDARSSEEEALITSLGDKLLDGPPVSDGSREDGK